MKIIIIGNYAPDKQESMERFAKMLESGMLSEGINVEIWRPIVFFGTFNPFLFNSVNKWVGYVDKYLLFPFVIVICRLFYELKYKKVFFHISDHSNAMYLPYLPKKRSSITCHDVLAIRGAMGYKDAYCEASKFGEILQKWILSNLAKARCIICVSHFTLSQLMELTGKNVCPEYWKVIHNSFNANFSSELTSKSLKLGINLPYILHVGSDLPRKNRKLLVDMLIELGDKWNGNICFAGKKIEKALSDYIFKNNLKERVIEVIKPEHSILVSLYQDCEAFIFPSFSEGFGWPVIEAQACGVPVITSDVEPMFEISGNAAIHVSPNNPKGFAEALLSLKNDEFRNHLCLKGKENVKRFNSKKVIREYLELFKL